MACFCRNEQCLDEVIEYDQRQINNVEYGANYFYKKDRNKMNSKSLKKKVKMLTAFNNIESSFTTNLPSYTVKDSLNVE